MRWVDDVAERDGLDCRETLLLTKFAAYAQADMTSWAKVDTLERQSRSSERKVQYMLRDFEARGYIRRSGRMHTLAESGREVPVYVWAGFLDDFAAEAAPASGARRAPEASLGCTDGGGTGAQGVHPQIEPIEPNLSSPGGEERARTREAVFLELEGAFPKPGLGATHRDRARAALWTLLDEGFEAPQLVAAAKGYAADRGWKRKDLGLDHWLHDRRFRAWMPDPELPLGAPGAAGDPGEHGFVEKLRHAVKPHVDDGKFGSYVQPLAVVERGATAYVIARTGFARDWVLGHVWRRVEGAWRAAGETRALILITKTDFEALGRQGSE